MEKSLISLFSNLPYRGWVWFGSEIEDVDQLPGNNVFRASTVNDHLAYFLIDCASSLEKGMSLKMSFSFWCDENTLKQSRKLIAIIGFQKFKVI